MRPRLLAGAVVAALWAPVLDPRQQLFWRDTQRFFYPFKLAIAERLRRGELPLWDPWTESGASVLGQLTPGLWHPATLLYLARLITVVFVAARHARQRQASTGPSVRVAVLVPAYREEIVISRCVASLRASAYPDLQIVVIDDGSDDRTAAVAREAAGDDRRVLVLQKPNGGKASALNHGLASTDAEVIVVVDADSIVERDALAELVKPLGDPSVGAVAGNVKVGNRSNLLGAMQHLEYVVGINLDRRFFDQVAR